jgi:hypothetical protein
MGMKQRRGRRGPPPYLQTAAADVFSGTQPSPPHPPPPPPPPPHPPVNVYLPKDRVTNAHQGYGFVEFRGEDDADYVSGAGRSRAQGSSWAAAVI